MTNSGPQKNKHERPPVTGMKVSYHVHIGHCVCVCAAVEPLDVLTVHVSRST